MDRLFHARGQGLPDILRLRAGAGLVLPDAVCRPGDAGGVAALLERCSLDGIRMIPWGGGTSVTGGVNAPSGPEPVVSVDLSELSGLVDLDVRSGLATFDAGTTGPQVEAALEPHGLTLGHFPQSWEFSTVGGWIATRSSGQESMGYGRIDDLVAGLELVSPAGRLVLQATPGTAAGPELRRLVTGSEGRFGVITRATLRVRPRPEARVVTAALLRGWDDGLEVVRELVQAGVPLTMVRLSDAAETQVAMAIGLASSRLGGVLRRYLDVRRIGGEACLLLFGTDGTPWTVRSTLSCARSVIRRHRGVILGTSPGRKWLADRFRHPYLRDALLDRGFATDTFETSATWSQVDEVRAAVSTAVDAALDQFGEKTALLCHVSHPYRDGTSLYFTFFFRSVADPEENISRWATVKRAATEALVASGATVSHHHGVGSWHAPWLEAEIGPLGRDILSVVAGRLDPRQILNPHVLVDPTDRLEE